MNQQWLIEQHRHLLAYYEELIALLTRFSLQRTEALAKANERPLRNAERIQHYERLISQQQRMLASTQASYQRAAERLHQWTVSERGQ